MKRVTYAKSRVFDFSMTLRKAEEMTSIATLHGNLPKKLEQASNTLIPCRSMPKCVRVMSHVVCLGWISDLIIERTRCSGPADTEIDFPSNCSRVFRAAPSRVEDLVAV